MWPYFFIQLDDFQDLELRGVILLQVGDIITSLKDKGNENNRISEDTYIFIEKKTSQSVRLIKDKSNVCYT